MAKTHYDDSFYGYQMEGSLLSAMEMVPMIYDLFKPKSIIDIGCGVGGWLRAFKEICKIDDIRGVDGEYVKVDNLKIPRENFVSYDLTKYYDAGRKFDLSMSLEVGEHLPDSAADDFVKTLVTAARKVVFSAALPGQGGTFHINEQFPEYWASKFAKYDFVPVDYFRKKIWNNEKIEWWYRQNILVFVHKDELANYPQLQDAYQKTDGEFLSRIHPNILHGKEMDIARLKNPIKNLRYHLYLVKQKFRSN
jgi:SAM-dependent methyltransferase